MKIYIKIKSIGKKRPILENVPYTIPDGTDTVRKLICALVKTEVENYNEKGTDVQLIQYLSNAEIEEKAGVGKVGFGCIYSEKKANLNEAIENACQCYEDGLVRIFINEEETGELDAPLEIKEDDNFTFIRLTFLAGRIW